MVKYILKHTYYVINGLICTPHKKNLLFHNAESMGNYIRNDVDASILIRLEVEQLTVE